jgi:serine/threonine protein kinase
MKKKFKTTKIESLLFKDMMDPSIEYKFSDFYKYIGNLGAGSFGFVVSAIDITTNQKMALKVSYTLHILN